MATPKKRRKLLIFSGIGVLLVALALLALLVIFVALYLVPAARALLARRRAALAFKRLEASIDYLLGEAASAEASAFLAALLRALRLYLAARALPGAEALTASELSALPEAAFPAPATRDRAAALVALADRHRYGGAMAGTRAGPAAAASSPRDFLESAAREAVAICRANEEALLARL
jgi:hypothetical protein